MWMTKLKRKKNSQNLNFDIMFKFERELIWLGLTIYVDSEKLLNYYIFTI